MKRAKRELNRWLNSEFGIGGGVVLGLLLGVLFWVAVLI